MKNRDAERSRDLTRRALILGAGQAALFAGLASRLVWLQVVERQKFQTLSDRNRISMRLVPAGRGEIMDRFGVPLAINSQNFRAVLVPEQSPDAEKALEMLSRLIPLSAAERAAALKEAKRNRSFVPVLVKENLTWDDMARVELNLPDLPGVSIEEGETRGYPLGEATAHVIGYVGRVSEAELEAAEQSGEGREAVMTTPGFRIGKNGVEKSYDEVLRGEAGQRRTEVNVVGREIRELGEDRAAKGKRLTLTLDADIQMLCQERLAKEKSGAAVLMDVKTGEVYALCSYPGFDPNVFSQGIPADMWEELLSSDAHPLTNKPISGQYPPGSTFKMVTALAAMEAGIDPGMSVNCPGWYAFGGRRFHCWRWNRGGHGAVNLTQAIAQSCDCYFYDVGHRIGIDAIAQAARALGLGSRLDFGVPAEMPGLVPDRAWKRQALKQEWHPGETLNIAIGQGQTLATPLQLATMTSRLVNGGFAVKPRLVRSIEGEGSQIPPEWERLKVRPQSFAAVMRGMNEAVNGPRGTGKGAAIKEAPYSMGGKTGTAQVRRITEAMRAQGMTEATTPWKYRDHALFIGYGPTEAPRYAAAVVVEHGMHGASAAAPIVRDILLAAQKRDPRTIRTVDAAEIEGKADARPVLKPKPRRGDGR